VLTNQSILAYDPMGRVLREQQCTRTTCTTGTPYAPIYDYDLAGNLVHHSNGIATRTFTNCYDAAGRLLSMSGISGSCPASSPPASPLFSAPSYSPFGGLTGALFGGGLQLQRSYDSRLRISSETDTGNGVATPTPGSATIPVTGTEQTH
jgi:YD repeat-containing protein